MQERDNRLVEIKVDVRPIEELSSEVLFGPWRKPEPTEIVHPSVIDEKTGNIPSRLMAQPFRDYLPITPLGGEEFVITDISSSASTPAETQESSQQIIVFSRPSTPAERKQA